MRASKTFLPTLRDAPAEAELRSHSLLVRGGFIKRISAGVYVYLPLGLKVLNKVMDVVREEANRAGSVELLMPTLVPFDLLRETGRDTVEVLYKTVDRTEREFALGFTHEEVITDVVRTFVHSYKDMPLCLYQIQNKFRDEPRPRGGLIRGKEFIMFDAYSFDTNEDDVDGIYKRMWTMYERAFTRMGLKTLVCEAESGDIGGSDNHEFMVIADAGEDSVLMDDRTGIAANAERADVGGTYNTASCEGVPGAQIVETPGRKSVADQVAFLGYPPQKMLKTMIMKAEGRTVAAIVRGDRQLNAAKLARRLGVGKVEFMEPEEVLKVCGAEIGFAGPIGLEGVEIIADQEIAEMADFVVGANQNDRHYDHVCHGRDFKVDRFEDIRVAVEGDPSVGGGVLKEVRGIEVGHIFKLGTKYSEAMGATFADAEGKEYPIIMGCYGLGIGRSMQAVAEVSNDENGLIWPISIAPYEVVIVLVNPEDSAQADAAEQLYTGLLDSGVDALLDDRPDRAGSKFKDADLLGFPLRVVCGRGVSEGKIEAKWRNQDEVHEVTMEDAHDQLMRMISDERNRYT